MVWLCSDPQPGDQASVGDTACNMGQGCVWARGAVKEPEPSPIPKSRGSSTGLCVWFFFVCLVVCFFLTCTPPEPHLRPWHVPCCVVWRYPQESEIAWPFCRALWFLVSMWKAQLRAPHLRDYEFLPWYKYPIIFYTPVAFVFCIFSHPDKS